MVATTINSFQDLLRVLDENPEWLNALRARLLTRELLELPQRLSAFVETTGRQFEAIDKRFEAIDKRFEAIDKRFEAVDKRFEAVDQRLEAIDKRFEAVDRQFAQLRSDLAPIKAAHARNSSLREADLIAEDNGLSFVRVFSDAQVAELARSRPAAGVAKNELRSFRRADLIVEGLGEAGQTCYLAAEISYTVNGRDTDRAIRNAGLLTQFTGQPALAVVAGLRYDTRIKQRLEAGEVSWYQLDPQTLEVE